MAAWPAHSASLGAMRLHCWPRMRLDVQRWPSAASRTASWLGRASIAAARARCAVNDLSFTCAPMVLSLSGCLSGSVPLRTVVASVHRSADLHHGHDWAFLVAG